MEVFFSQVFNHTFWHRGLEEDPHRNNSDYWIDSVDSNYFRKSPEGLSSSGGDHKTPVSELLTWAWGAIKKILSGFWDNQIIFISFACFLAIYSPLELPVSTLIGSYHEFLIKSNFLFFQAYQNRPSSWDVRMRSVSQTIEVITSIHSNWRFPFSKWFLFISFSYQI